MRKLFLFCLFTQISFSQIELMQNNFPTNPSGVLFPDATVDLFACLTGSAAGANGVPITLSYHQYLGWGGHTHETANSHRPEPFIFGLPTQLTNGGCTSWTVQFNGYAGGYTFQATSPGFPVKGINYITRQYTAPMINGLRTPKFLAPYQNLGSNAPYNLHLDSLHLPDSTRFITVDASAKLRQVSEAYKALTLNQTGFIEVLDITRVSLPDGGIFDNDFGGYAPGPDATNAVWETRPFEEHARGVEIDMVVPSDVLREGFAFVSITASGCALGKFTPWGNVIFDPASPWTLETQLELHWRTKGIMHVICQPGQALKGGPRGPAH